MSLPGFREEFRERVLELLWRQWVSLGVTGTAPQQWGGSVIDPEALLLVSCTLARLDARLFDAILEWMLANGQFINVQRLKRMMGEEFFEGERVLRAIAATVETSDSQAKWGKLAVPQCVDCSDPLFSLDTGNALPVVGEADPVFKAHGFVRERFEPRGVAKAFPPKRPANLLIRLRALLGTNARCETILFLLLNERGSPRHMASQCYYYPATLAKTLQEMACSGFVISRKEGRMRLYSLTPDLWRELLLGGEESLRWIVWARLFSALEEVWWFLQRDELEPLLAASALRRLLLGSVVERIEQSLAPFVFGDVQAHKAEELIPFFIERMRAAFKLLGV